MTEDEGGMTEERNWKALWRIETEENARLRAALKRIADQDVSEDLKGRAMLSDVLAGIAWAALNQSP